MAYYPPHTRKDALSRRTQRLRRALRSVINPPGADLERAAGQICYWVSDTPGSWYDKNNWSATSGGAGGIGYPSATSAVTFDGEGTGKCTLESAVTCAAISFTEAGAQVNSNFDQNGQQLTCSTFTYNCANNTSTVLDGPIVLTGATFTVTAAQNDAILASATITAGVAVTVTSTDDTAIPQITAADDITFATAITVARLILSSATVQALEFLNGVDFTLTAYTVGDWDGASGQVNTIVSDDATTWGFVNPASMVVAYINVQDSNATNAIDATDNCVDGTGNTNWTFS